MKKCTDKIPYPNSSAAARAMKASHKKRSAAKPYHCSICGKWHLGRKAGSGTKKPYRREKYPLKPNIEARG